MTVFALLCMLASLVRSDLAMRLARRAHPDGLLDFVTRSNQHAGSVLLILAGMLTRFRVRVERWRGAPLPDRFLLVSNHQSLMDIPCLAVVFRSHAVRFVAKRELGRRLPYISLALRAGGDAMISRTSDYREGARELRRFARLSDRGICPVVFPEGTRSRDGRLLPFNAGAFRIVLEERPLPVLVVAIDGAWRTATLTGMLTRLGRARYRIRPIALHPAPRGKREILTLLERVQSQIADQLTAWRTAALA